MWFRLVDFSGGSVATGRKPVVGGRAVHSSSFSLVGYRRTNEGYCSLLYSSIHTRTGARTSRRASWLAPLRPLFDWLPLHPCPPSFCSRGTERKRGNLLSSSTVARQSLSIPKERFCRRNEMARAENNPPARCQFLGGGIFHLTVGQGVNRYESS